MDGFEEKSKSPSPDQESDLLQFTQEQEDLITSTTDFDARNSEERDSSDSFEKIDHIKQPSENDVGQYAQQRSDVVEEKIPVQVKSKGELTSFPARWMKGHNIDKRIIELIYWTNWQKTGPVFAGLLFVFLSLTMYTFLSVITFFSMALLVVSFLYRIGMSVLNAVQKTGTEHPFKHLLEEDFSVSEETIQQLAEEFRVILNKRVYTLRRIFLIEDVLESIKFGVVLWLLSYVGSWFSLATLTIIACVLIFSVPKLYEDYQDQVDKFVDAGRNKIKEITAKVQEKLPEKLQFGKDKEE